MKINIIFALSFALLGCTSLQTPSKWTGPNPLDPVQGEPTAEEIRGYHMYQITGNPTFLR